MFIINKRKPERRKRVREGKVANEKDQSSWKASFANREHRQDCQNRRRKSKERNEEEKDNKLAHLGSLYSKTKKERQKRRRKKNENKIVGEGEGEMRKFGKTLSLWCFILSVLEKQSQIRTRFTFSLRVAHNFTIYSGTKTQTQWNELFSSI